MPIQKVDIEIFLELAKQHPVIDVRSPGEFLHAHIPAAHSLPLFTDDERKIVGTAYKQQSKQKAIKIGLEYFGKKTVAIIEAVENLLEKSTTSANNSNTILVHCWRGGMRSGGVAWLLDLYGFKVYTLAGGYKGFRNWVLKQTEKDYQFKILGGYTGSGKTEVLDVLKAKGVSVIDLENLAGHKGSAFGNLNMVPQPSQEMFENKLAVELWKIETSNANNRNNSHEVLIGQKTDLNTHQKTEKTNQPFIWVEDESQRIGTVIVPTPIYKQIRGNQIFFINIPFEERLNYIVQWYGKGDKEKLINAIVRIKKKLGGLETKTSINFLLEDNLKESFRVLLHYYDKLYLKGLHNRESWEHLLTQIECTTVDAKKNAQKLLSIQDTIN